MSTWQCSACFREYSFKEFTSLPTQWLFPDDATSKKEYGKTSVCHCGGVFHKTKWQLTSFKDGYLISTVHLNLAHYSNYNWVDDTPMHFETMIKDSNELWLGFQARYNTMQQAIDGHWLTYDSLAKIMLNPQSYPTDVIHSFCNFLDSANDMKEKYSSKTKQRYV